MANWQRELETICNRIKYDEPLSNHTSFKIGGFALALIEVSERCELKKLAHKSKRAPFIYKSRFILSGDEWNLPIIILGRGTNVLFDDSGYKGIIVKLTDEFKKIEINKNNVTVGAGVSLNKLAVECAKSGLSGLEFAYGIPGSVGGALIMNAGAHGSSFSDVVKQVELVENSGNLITISKEKADFSYRKSNLDKYFCVTGARLELEAGVSSKIKERMTELYSIRKLSQPLGELSAGCIFKNPPNDSAGHLIDQCGLKGKKVGGAEVSSKHANFIINKKNAKALDIRELIKLIRMEVKKRKGVKLELELKIL